MKILIHGINYAPEPTGIAVYTSGMARWLAARGHDVQVISGQPYYPGWKIMPGFHAHRYTRTDDGGVRLLRCPLYIPAEPSGTKRIIHHASFAATSLLPTLWQALRTRPDVVLTIAPSLTASLVARIAAALSGAKGWVHIQDFEVEAAFATGLLKPGGTVARLALGFERWMLRGFSRVSSISPQMCRKLAEKGIAPARIVEFRNWADLSRIQPTTAPSPYRAAWGITTRHVALYSGSIGKKQGIELLIDAARTLAHRDDLTFVICGEGPYRATLEQLARGLPNIRFHDLQPMDRLNDLLGMATIHLLPQLHDAADLVLPSKLTNMMASGRPVIATTAPDTGLAHELTDCGLITPPGDAPAFAAAIASLADDEPRRAALGAAARRAAEERVSGDGVLSRFVEQLRALVGRDLGVPMAGPPA